ncbi:MAG: hypothetical protein ACHRHE_15780 [Tepidisphaerales bacterium]
MMATNVQAKVEVNVGGVAGALAGAMLMTVLVLPCLGQAQGQPARDFESAAFWFHRAVVELSAETKPEKLTMLDFAVMGQAKLGDAQDLPKVVEMLGRLVESQTEPMGRAIFLASSARLQWHLGDKDKARISLARADAECAKVTDPTIRSMVYVPVMQSRAVMGDWDGAARIAQDEKDPVRRAGHFDALALLAAGLKQPTASADYLHRAQAIADGATPAEADKIRGDAGMAYVQLGDYPAAQTLAQAITDPAARVFLYCIIAGRQKEAGDKLGYERNISMAGKDAARIVEADDKSFQYTMIASTQCDHHDKPGALESLRLARTATDTIADLRTKARSLRRLAETQAKAGDIPGCLASVQLADDATGAIPATDRTASDAPWDLCDVGQALGRAGEIESATKLLGRVDDELYKSGIHRGIIEGLIKLGLIAEAQRQIKNLTDPHQQAMSCRLIAEAMAKAKQWDDLRVWIDGLPTAPERAGACVGAGEGIMGERVNQRGLQMFQIGL